MLRKQFQSRLTVFSVEHPGMQPLQQLKRQGVTHPVEGFVPAFQRWKRDHRQIERGVLFVDHAEELGSIASSRVRDHFLNQLGLLCDTQNAAGSGAWLSVVIAVREDSLSALTAAAPWLLSVVEQSLVYLPVVPDRDEWQRIVQASAQSINQVVEPAFLEAMARDLDVYSSEVRHGARDEAVLPHLSVCLSESFHRKSPASFHKEAYETVGGIVKCIGLWAHDAWGQLSETEQTSLLPLLQSLCFVAADGVRVLPRPVSLTAGLPSEDRDDETASDSGSTNSLDGWQRLADLGLVRLNRATETVELAHAVLLRELPALRRYHEQERRFAAWHNTMSSLMPIGDSDATRKSPPRLSAEELAESVAWVEQRPTRVSAPVRSIVEQQQHSVPPSTAQPAAAPASEQPQAVPQPVAVQPPSVWFLVSGWLLWGMLAAFALALLVVVRWMGGVQVDSRRGLQSEQAARAALLVHQAGLDGEALRLAINAAAPSLLRGERLPAAVVEGLMVVLSVARNSLALHGHEDRITAVAYSPDGTRLATAGDDNTVRIWDPVAARLLATLSGHDRAVNAVAFAKDGNRLLSASRDKTVRIWDTTRGLLLQSLAVPSGVPEFAIWSIDGQLIVVGCDDGSVFLWGLRAGNQPTRLVGHTQAVLGADITRDGKWVVTYSRDHTARVWSAEQGRLVAELKGHTDTITTAQFSPSGDLLATGSRDRTVRLWSRTGSELGNLSGPQSPVRTVAFAPTGRQLAASDASGAVHMWDSQTGRLTATLVGHVDIVDAIGFTPDGRHIISAGYDRTVRIWTTQSPRQLAVLKGHAGKIYSLAVSPDGQHVATVGYDKTVRIWDLQPSTPEAILEGHQGRVQHIHWGRSDGSRLVTAGADNTVRVWDWPTGRLVLTLSGHSRQVYRAVISPDGSRIASASADGTVRIWNGQTGDEIAQLKQHDGEVYGLALRPDGTQFVSTGEDGKLRMWDVQTGRALATISTGQPNIEWLAYSPDGTRIVSTHERGEVVLWDAVKLSRLSTLPGNGNPVSSALFVSRGNGNTILTGGEDRTLRLWNADTGEPIKLLHTLPDRVENAAVSRNRERLVVVGKDHVIRLWDLRREEPLVELPVLADDLQFSDYSPDGMHFAIAGSDGTVKIYRDDYVSDHWGMVATACRLLAPRPEYDSARETCARFAK